jgi:hypothetical protein
LAASRRDHGGNRRQRVRARNARLNTKRHRVSPADLETPVSFRRELEATTSPRGTSVALPMVCVCHPSMQTPKEGGRPRAECKPTMMNTRAEAARSRLRSAT